MRILAIEDNCDIAANLGEFLEVRGHTANSATHPEGKFMFIRSLVLAALVLAIGPAFAQDSDLHLMDKQQFAAFDQQVKSDLQGHTRYREISQADQDDLLNTLAQMEARWQRADASGKLNVDDSIKMANDQEVVNTILHHAAVDSRVICSRETPMGTLISKNVCRTVAQIRRDQDSSRNELRDMQKQSAGTGGH
jgi:hypothetical protein